jgi:glucose-1-phosphate cytidylyltransferase
LKVVILAGGHGTRLSEETTVRPKPMVQIGGVPILVHLMGWYASHGYDDFVVACGYLGSDIKDYFADFRLKHADFSIDLGSGETSVLGGHAANWNVTLIDTGLHTMTGGRLSRLRDFIGDDTFMMTYGDGLADVDISALEQFHRSHGKLATVTAVSPPARFGSLAIDENSRVERFEEKIASSEARINGGFFVLEPEVLDYIDGDDMSFEREPLKRLAAAGELCAFVHDGFWKAMDTLRDRNELETIWASGNAPWLVEE